MPNCYLLTVCSGSSVDQQSNNPTLFNLVEQLNIPPNAPRPAHTVVPLEVHSYWKFDGAEVGKDYEVRVVVCSLETSLETSGEIHLHRALAPRLRTRVQGLPFPSVAGTYQVCVDWRAVGIESWTRSALKWPLTITEDLPQTRVTH